MGVYYLLQWAVLFKTSFSSCINILVWEVCRNGEKTRNKFDGSSLPVLLSLRSVCVQRGGRSECCSHTSQMQFSCFIPSSAFGFLALLSKYIFSRNPTRWGDMQFVPCLHLGILSWLWFPQVSPSSAQPRTLPRSQHLSPPSPFRAWQVRRGSAVTFSMAFWKIM